MAAVQKMFNVNDMMVKRILSLFKRNKEERLNLKDVKVGQVIIIEYDKAAGFLANLKCLNNDPKTKKILLEIEWNVYNDDNTKVIGSRFEKLVFSYSDKEFKNFHLLNKVKLKMSDDDDDNIDSEVANIKRKIASVIKKEDYVKAAEIREKIKTLLPSE